MKAVDAARGQVRELSSKKGEVQKELTRPAFHVEREAERANANTDKVLDR
jgi:hypothetical protein